MNTLDMSGILAQVTTAVGKFIDAATPIAQKAYQIGLITLQVDAASVIVPAIVAILISVWLLRKLNGKIKGWKQEAEDTNKRLKELQGQYYRSWEMKDWMDMSPFDSIGYPLTLTICWLPAVIGIANLLNIWLWVKLFSPELWLVHAAIEKVVQVSTK